MHRTFWFLIKLGISIAIIGYLFNRAYQEQQFESLYSTQKNWGWCVLALTCCISAHLISYFRWHIMAKAIGLSMSLWETVKVGFIGSFFNLFAFGVIGGDSLRAYYAARQSKRKVAEAVSSVFADRVIGLITMCGIAVLAFNLKDFGDENSLHWHRRDLILDVCRVATVLFCLGVGAFVVLFLSPQIRQWPIFKWVEKQRQVGPLFAKLMDVVKLYRQQPLAMFHCFCISVFVNVLFAVSIYALACGLVDSHPSFPNHLIIGPISMVANAVPLPGGIGGMEFALDFLYQGFSHQAVPSESGFVVAVAFRFVLLSISVIGSVFWFAYKREVSSEISQASVGHR